MIGAIQRKKSIDSNDVRMSKLSELPGGTVVCRTDQARDANPERLNLDKRNLESCPLLQGEGRLRLLNLQNNRIKKMGCFYGMPNLIFLDLYNNQIEEIEQLNLIPTLRVLMLGKNRIRCMAGLEVIPRLDVLDLHSNQIQSISHLEGHAELRVLNLAGNQLESIDNLRGLYALTELNARKNAIMTVHDLGDLPNLQTVFLSENCIKTFEDAESLFSSRSIVDLALDKNPICNLEMFRGRSIQSISSLCFLNLIKITDAERTEVVTKNFNLIDYRCLSNEERKSRTERQNTLEKIEEEWNLKASRGNENDPWEEVNNEGCDDHDSREEPNAKNLVNESPNFSEVETDGECHKLAVYGNSFQSLKSAILHRSIDSICFHFIHISAIEQCQTWLKHFTKLKRLEFWNNQIERLCQLKWVDELTCTQLVIKCNPVNNVRFLRQSIATNLKNIQALNDEEIGSIERAEKLKYSSALKIDSLQQLMDDASAKRAIVEKQLCLKQRKEAMQMAYIFDAAVDKAIRNAMKC